MHVKDKLKFIGRTAINNSVIYQVCYVESNWGSRSVPLGMFGKGKQKFRGRKLFGDFQESAGLRRKLLAEVESYGRTFFIQFFCGNV